MDDQAETVLLALFRGGGLEAVSGITPRWGHLARPLIAVRRGEVMAFVRAMGLRPRQDSTNLDTDLMRNALRLEGIPALEQTFGRDIIEPIARSASLLQVDEDFVRTDSYLRLVAAEKLWKEPEKALSVRLLRSLHRALASRLIRDTIHKQLRVRAEEAHVDAVLDLVQGRPGRRVDLPGGFTAVREREYIRLSPSPES
jgi:tRNA(Ile)-lysidine synthase